MHSYRIGENKKKKEKGALDEADRRERDGQQKTAKSRDEGNTGKRIRMDRKTRIQVTDEPVQK